jgi:FKBP-type peptidyl-prolyl cis-trans isomerase FklB
MACGSGDTSQEPAPLTSALDSVSYAVGVFLGDSYRQQEIALDPGQIYRGLNDAMTGRPQMIDDSLVRLLINRLEAETAHRQQEQLSRQAAENLSAARAFLETNRRRDSVIELASGLQYRVLKPGTGASPTLDNEVRINYQGRLLDGTRFDQSARYGSPVVMHVDEVIPGWTEALTRMKPGARWELYIPPKLAYGAQGRSPLVPPQALLIFEVELLEIVR